MSRFVWGELRVIYQVFGCWRTPEALHTIRDDVQPANKRVQVLGRLQPDKTQYKKGQKRHFPQRSTHKRTLLFR